MLKMDNGYQKLNDSFLRVITRALEADPARDMEEVFKRVYTSYQRQRPLVDERRERRRRNAAQTPSATHPYEPGEVQQANQANLVTRRVPLTLLTSLSSKVGTDSHIISPLSPRILSFLDIGSHQSPAQEIGDKLIQTLSIREPLIINGQRVIVALTNDILVKMGPNLGIEEHNLLEFLKDNVPTVIAPRPLGFLKIGTISCMFMTRLSGETLKNRWKHLSSQEKHAVQTTLDNMLIDLRKVRLPVGTPMGSFSDEPRCKDCRRDLRISPCPIYTEAQFNDFITSSKTSRASAGYRKWVLSMMREDHHILLTHGDLHPDNIIVDMNGEDGMIIGIIDWELGGFYPEYWEMLKALNLRAVDDPDDWWDFLPQSILGYSHDVAVDRLIEATLLV